MSVNQRNIVKSIHGDKVIMFTDSHKLKGKKGIYTVPTISQWYDENPETNHLGLMSMFGQGARKMYSMGIMNELLQKRNVLDLKGSRSFTYDIPVEEDKKCLTVRDHSDQSYPGMDQGTFKISLSEQFEPGDILTLDPLRGDQIIVSAEEPVINKGDSYEHVVTLNTNDKDAYYSASQLAPGLQYTKISHTLGGEFDDAYWSSVSQPNTSGYYRCEFHLGNDTGVESFVTGKADRMFSGAAASTSTKSYLDKLMGEAEMMGGDVAILMDATSTARNGDPKTMRLCATVELLVRKELEKLLNYQLFFQKAGTLAGTNGATKLNEGIWHQMRRGKLIKYSRPMGMTKQHISEAVEYLYRNNPLPAIDRYIMFECGTEMEKNFLAIFAEEINQQLNNVNDFNPVLFGDSMQLPKSPISGDLQNLKLESVRFTQVYLPGIGNVRYKLNTNLDYVVDVDRFQQGFHPNGKNYTTYSAVIFDAVDQEYSNNRTVPTGTKLIEGGNDKANLYLVKPEGSLVISGQENGRYDPYSSSNIVSSSRGRSMMYWAYASVAAFIPDPSRFVMIELDDSSRFGYV